MPVRDLAPVVHARAAERVGADADARLADGVEVEHGRQVVDVRAEEVVRRGVGPGARERDATYAAHPGRDQLVGPGGDDAGRVGVGGTAVRRVVLEAAVGGRVVRRGDDDAVGEAGAGGPPAVGADDRVGDRRGRRVAVAVVDQHGDVVGRQHLERRRPRGLGQGVRVAADEERTVVALRAAVVADRLRRRRDVGVVERGLEARPAVPARAERDLLVHVAGVRDARVVGGDQVGDVDQVAGLGELSGAGCCICGCHGAILVPTASHVEDRHPEKSSSTMSKPVVPDRHRDEVAPAAHHPGGTR